jgi:hypothetical protein
MDYETLVNLAATDPAVIGLILVGSRGKGFENEHSDHDVVMIVRDGAVVAAKQRYAGARNVDLSVFGASDFARYAEWQGPDEWDRYSFAHAKIVIDRSDGALPKQIEEKGRIPPDQLDRCIDGWLDGYVNGVFRSVKCVRNGNALGARLEAANSMLDLLTLVFAINGRHRPFLGYLQQELDRYPLRHLPWPSRDFVEKVGRVLATADLKTQQELLAGMATLARERATVPCWTAGKARTGGLCPSRTPG